MTAKEFLEDFDPQIKEVGHEAHTYTIEQVITRMDAYLKSKVKPELADILLRKLPDLTPISVGSLVMSTGERDSNGNAFDEGVVFKVLSFKDGKYSLYLPYNADAIWNNIESQEIKKI